MGAASVPETARRPLFFFGVGKRYGQPNASGGCMEASIGEVISSLLVIREACIFPI